MNDSEVIAKYIDLVSYIAKSRTAQKSDADDVCQEVFLRYIDKSPVFRSEEHARAWFIRVTINVSKSFYTSAEYARRAEVEEGVYENIPSDEDFFGQIESNTVFEELISAISPQYRVAMMLRFDYGYTVKEIAKLTGNSEGKTRALLMRGKQQYKEFLLKGENNHE